MSIKCLYNFKNLLQRQMERQMSGNYYEIRRVYLSFFQVSFNTNSCMAQKKFMETGTVFDKGRSGPTKNV